MCGWMGNKYYLSVVFVYIFLLNTLVRASCPSIVFNAILYQTVHAEHFHTHQVKRTNPHFHATFKVLLLTLTLPFSVGQNLCTISEIDYNVTDILDLKQIPEYFE